MSLILPKFHNHAFYINFGGTNPFLRDNIVSNNLPLPVFFLFSTGLKWIVGIGQTSCMGSASIRHAFRLSHPAPSKYKPRMYTPS